MATQNPTDSLIRGIDRILIQTQDVERVFARFRHEFGLPIAWPLTDCGLLVSGGLYAGNMTIEIGRFAGFGLPGTWLYGLGFAPWQPTWEMVEGLRSRKVLHAPSLTLTYESPLVMQPTLTFLRNLLDGQPNAAFWLGQPGGGNTRIGRALSNLRTWMAGTDAGSKTFSLLLGSSLVFMCDNHSNPHQERLAEVKATWRKAKQNGPYGITGVAGIDLEVSTNIAGWKRLLDRPDLNADSVHSFSTGPLLRFHPGAGNRLLGIEFACADLPSIAQQLREKQSAAFIEEKRVTLSPDQMDGLVIGLSQSPAATSEKS
ncbi:MAG: hypothetical protein JSS38_13440 [Nitrospira sp.]|nr:hypothetical protein [Nitrospira sp.]MBS0155596.1 hypothetical protein [Nitrospira sp.]